MTATISRLQISGRHHASPLDFADILRLDITPHLDVKQQIEWGQFFTSAAVAKLMAGMFDAPPPSVRLLDAGAGVGSLTAAYVAELCGREERPRTLEVTAYETDGDLLPYLKETLSVCREQCDRADILFTSNIIHDDFIVVSAELLKQGAKSTLPQFNSAILNPPYRKLRSDSDARRALSSIGIETTNLYTAFLWLAVRLLQPGGEMVSITPRSFCNGPYFKPFRVAFNDAMDFRRFHLFESRVDAFRDNEVLQENVILHATKKIDETAVDAPVIVSSSVDADGTRTQSRAISTTQIIRPNDADAFINLVADVQGQQVADQMDALPLTLKELGISVSTGRVVDFRTKDNLRMEAVGAPKEIVAPLIYPSHFGETFVVWPKEASRKANALAVCEATQTLLVPRGFYVLVKRLSSKEQKRRISAVIYDPERVTQNGKPSREVAFENHLNYFHENGEGLSRELAAGLATFLNSTVVDTFFRQFNGHTQVNATDLRSLKYPTRVVLETLGAKFLRAHTATPPSQTDIDALITQEIMPMAEDQNMIDPAQSKTRLDEALQILKAIQLERQQLNERSALTLLAILDLTADQSWSQADNPLRGITPMMDFFREHYGKNYAPNTRETVRRQSVHQFIQAGLLVANPDDPKRPINSAKNVYQVTPEALELVRAFGTPDWEEKLSAFVAMQDAIRARATRQRAINRIPVRTPSGEVFELSPGGQNPLIKEIVEAFCSRYTPGGKILYLGDADEKWASYDKDALAALGVVIDEHGAMPDVVVHYTEKNWLILVEAVTSHGPVDQKRHLQLKELFNGSTAGLVFVTAFVDRSAMGKYLRDIAWETEVWVADAPDHLIHFNGERFLGPYSAE